MIKSVTASIRWIPHEDGGRKKQIPTGIRYNPIIVFEGQDVNCQTWSADIYVLEHIDNRISNIQLSYLVPEAPFSYLVSGNKFKLLEGAKEVATGEIL